MMDKYGTPWTRDELVLALYLYCQIPFSKTKANNPEVVKLAALLGRTPSSVARKLGNFGAFDELLAAQGITGLSHASKADESIWREYNQKWENLVSDSQVFLRRLGAAPVKEGREEVIAITIPTGETEKKSLTVQRVYQNFFRRTVLSSYNSQCCISEIEIPELITAGHIIPWSESKAHRLDPENGLALCVLFDKAFDRGLMAIDDNFRVIYSKKIKNSCGSFIKSSFLRYEGRKITLPARFRPKREYLSWHRANVFLG